MAWKTNPDELEAARQELGLIYPVRVRPLKTGAFGQAGKYHGLGHWGPTTEERLDEPAHHISVKADLAATFANTCLLHEMTHAAQCESYLTDHNWKEANRRLALDFGREMRFIHFMSGKRGNHTDARYAGISFEVEARQRMDELSKQFTVVESVSSTDERDEDERPWNKFRVDLWTKKNVFRGTYYVYSTGTFIWRAKDFAKEKWGAKTDKAEAYLIEEGLREDELNVA